MSFVLLINYIVIHRILILTLYWDDGGDNQNELCFYHHF